VLCELDTTTGRLTWIGAGHHEPLLLRDHRLVHAFQVEPMLPLALNRAMSQTIPTSVGTAQLQPGDMLLLYTDGVTEARAPDDDFFGLTRSWTR
jgi:serine phosphatase RsbU (regulator of sigma subunit)